MIRKFRHPRPTIPVLMWGGDGNLYDCKAVIPESTFARIYQEIINFCKWHGNFDPATMGTVPNVPSD